MHSSLRTTKLLERGFVCEVEGESTGAQYIVGTGLRGGCAKYLVSIVREAVLGGSSQQGDTGEM